MRRAKWQKARLALEWVAVVASLACVCACSSGGTSAAAASLDGGPVPNSCPNLPSGTVPAGTCTLGPASFCAAAPNALGPACGSATSPCVALADNAGKSTFGLRIRALNVLAPAALASLQNIIISPSVRLKGCESPLETAGQGGFNWLLQLDTSAGTITSGGAPPSPDPIASGYCFYQGAYNGPSPVTVAPSVAPVTAGAGGVYTSAPQVGKVLYMPIFDTTQPTESLYVLPISDPAVDSIALSADKNCIGSLAGLGDPTVCQEWAPAGTLSGYITLQNADTIPLPQLNGQSCARCSPGNPARATRRGRSARTRGARTRRARAGTTARSPGRPAAAATLSGSRRPSPPRPSSSMRAGSSRIATPRRRCPGPTPATDLFVTIGEAMQEVATSLGSVAQRGFVAVAPTPFPKLDAALARLADAATPFARLAISKKIELLEDLSLRLTEVAPGWVAAACQAKGIDAAAPLAGEEWIAGPAVTLRTVRLLVRSLREIRTGGVPHLEEARLSDLAHGAVGVRVAPYDTFDPVLYGSLTAETWLHPDVQRSEVRAHQASFYQREAPEGAVSLVLGAGNVASIPPLDVLQKLFVEGHVCLLKLNPVNEYLGPFFERAFRPFIDQGYLAIVYGGGDVGAYLAGHPTVADVHITGSDKTHDLIVWGPPGPEQGDRKRRNAPLLQKPITSELGNVSPVIVVPGPYSDAELAHMAANVAGMVVNNASFNCNAAKVLVLPGGWPRRARFLELLSGVLAKVPPRRAYYPGAFERFESVTKGHPSLSFIGATSEGALPWTLVLGLDPNDRAEKNFVTEPFCSVLSEVSAFGPDPVTFLGEVVPFVNERLWGTLNATLFVHPTLENDPIIKRALDQAILGLRYGTVAINTWPALAYALGSTPWGGHPSATLADIQSGLGWVHNTVMLERIEKCVLRAPLMVKPKPVYFPGHRSLGTLGRKLTAFEGKPSWLKIPGLVATALKG